MRPVVLTGDIEQAFLQILIRKEHRDALRSHWITDKVTQQTTILRFTRAVFGLIQSPFLLGGTIECHIDRYQQKCECGDAEGGSFMWTTLSEEERTQLK